MDNDRNTGEGQQPLAASVPHQCRLGTSCKLLRRSEVLDLIGISKSTLHAWVNAGRFPRPVQLGPRARRWRECEVDDWRVTLPSVKS